MTDNDKQFTSSLTEWLTATDESFIVNSAADGFEAGTQVHCFEPDVVLLDLMMPELDGFAVCRWIKANPSPAYRQRIADAGAEACLSKPLDKARLLDLLKADCCKSTVVLAV
jgi:CheY-like chemotaxis protein